MTEEQAIQNGYRQVHLENEEECDSCGEEVLDGWSNEESGDFLCNDCRIEEEATD